MKAALRRFGILFYLLACLALLLFSGELFTRRFLIAKDFMYFQATPEKFPRHRLPLTYDEPGVTIRNGRREYHPRPQRPYNIAFVGDSVTFGRAADPDIFVEKIQTGQDTFNAYNYGVPGYGVVEIHQVMQKALEEADYDGVVYLFNYNDPKTSMSWRLSLLLRPEDRFASIDTYEGLKGKIEQFVKDHFKSITLLGVAAEEWGKTPQPRRTHQEASDKLLSVSEVAKWALEPDFVQEHWAQNKMYQDQALLEKVSNKLAEMNRWAQDQGIFFLVAFHHDYLVMKDGNQTFKNALIRACQKAGVDYLDTFELYRAHYREDGFYSDPRHLGRKGHAYLAQALQQAVYERTGPP